MKWYWTPKGWLFGVISVGLLAGAAFVNILGSNETISNILLVLGLMTLVYGYMRTYLNIKKKKQEVKQ